MKNFAYLIAGVAAAVAFFIARQLQQQQGKRLEPIDMLAHELQDAWADHHTVV